MNVQEFAELAAGHALGALSPADRDAFEHALVEHPEWATIVDADAATAAVLAEGAPAVAPPLAMRGILLSKILTTPQDGAEPLPRAAPDPFDIPPPLEVPDPYDTPAFTDPWDAPTTVSELAPEPQDPDQPAPPVEPPPTTATMQAVARRSWTRGLLTLAASLVILVVLGFGAVNLNQWVNRPAAVVALEEIESAPDAQSATVELTDGSGIATAHWSGSLGKAVLVADGLPTVTSDQTFEMWFVRQDGTPVSAGTFAAAGEETTALLAGAIEAGDTIAVTIEQAGGSSTGQPTSEPIVAIPTA